MRRRSLTPLLLMLWAALGVVLVALALARPAAAQDEGPTCPAGFVWKRMSGVGCVQEDCFDVANAKLSYTSACICLDGYRGCYEPVDSSGLDCGPHCPTSRLVACVDADSLCPGEEQARTPEPEPVETEPADTGDRDDADPGPDDGGTRSVDDLAKDLEDFLAGDGKKPTPGQAAAGGAALSTLITTWVLINALSGTSPAELLQAIQQVLGKKPTNGLPAGRGKPAASRPAGQQAKAPGIPLSSSGSVPKQPSTPAKSPTTPQQQAGKPSGQQPQQKPPAQKPGGTPEVTPEKLQLLKTRFRQIVAQKMKDGHYVRNPDFVRKAWNNVPGRLLDLLSGHKGGQCGDYAESGKKWIEPVVKELFGDSAVIDTITVEERTSSVQDDIFDEMDSWITANHTATRVILPNGESYVIDFWDAIQDQQVKWGTDVAYQQIFDQPAPRRTIEPVPEEQWIRRWKNKIGPSDSVVSNAADGERYLENLYQNRGSEEAGIQAWRDSRQRTVPDAQTDAVINYWRRKKPWY